jgi:hypothetical protein
MRTRAFIFPAVHHSFKFCALTIRGKEAKVESTDFTFFCRHFDDVTEAERHFGLTRQDLSLLNPNTHTCPVFRTCADAELTKKIYASVPVLVNESARENPWGLKFLTMFHMANDNGLFEGEPREGILPLYEAKMMFHFDHRYGTFEGATQAQLNVGSLPQPTSEQKADPTFITGEISASRAFAWEERGRWVSNRNNSYRFGTAGGRPKVSSAVGPTRVAVEGRRSTWSKDCR